MPQAETAPPPPLTPETILALEVFGNPVPVWAMALGVMIAVYAGLRILQTRGLGSLQKLAHALHAPWAVPFLRALAQTKPFILLVIALWAGANILTLPDKLADAIHVAALTVLLVQAGSWAVRFADSGMNRYRERHIAVNPSAVTTFGALALIAKLAIWVCVLLLILDNFGIDITALIAGLGIGGIAVALAAQSILSDLFASLTIAMDKPFVVGDFLILGDHAGTVEHIGLKTARIRSLSGEQIILSNSDLLSSRIRNYGRMFERRVVVTINITYVTKRAKLKLIPQIIRECIEAQDKTRFDRAHFRSYGTTALEFEYVYFVLARDYNTYMDINQAINFALHERFENEGIAFAHQAPAAPAPAPAEKAAIKAA